MNISPNRLILSLIVIALTLGIACASSAAVPREVPTAESATDTSALTASGAEASLEKQATAPANPAPVASAGTEASPEKTDAPVGGSNLNPMDTPVAASPSAGAVGSADAVPEKKTVPVTVFVGERPPDFAMLLLDGSTVTSEELALEGKPAFLMFFATW